MTDGVTIEAYLARILPSIISFALSVFRFNYVVVGAGVEENRGRCGGAKADPKRPEIKFWCLTPGTMALTILYAALSTAISFFVTALLRKEALGFAMVTGVIMLVVIIGAIRSPGFYLLEERHPTMAYYGGIIANLGALIASGYFAYVVIQP